MRSISNHIAEVRQHVALAAQRAGRPADSVCLVAVSKTRGVDSIRDAAAAGIRHFGENYVAEALPKIAATGDANLTWHFIGAIQANKTRAIATHFQWVQTVDRPRVAERLSAQRPESSGPLDVLIQVNIDDEPSKAGIAEAAVCEFAGQLVELPRLRVRGLMAIPRPQPEPERARHAFARMRALFDAARPPRADHWDTLSMGMTQDYEVAIEEGATMIRIGTALFGPRDVDAHD